MITWIIGVSEMNEYEGLSPIEAAEKFYRGYHEGKRAQECMKNLYEEEHFDYGWFVSDFYFKTGYGFPERVQPSADILYIAAFRIERALSTANDGKKVKVYLPIFEFYIGLGLLSDKVEEYIDTFVLKEPKFGFIESMIAPNCVAKAKEMFRRDRKNMWSRIHSDISVIFGPNSYISSVWFREQLRCEAEEVRCA